MNYTFLETKNTYKIVIKHKNETKEIEIPKSQLSHNVIPLCCWSECYLIEPNGFIFKKNIYPPPCEPMVPISKEEYITKLRQFFKCRIHKRPLGCRFNEGLCEDSKKVYMGNCLCFAKPCSIDDWDYK